MTYRRAIGDLVEIKRQGNEELSLIWRIRDVLALPGGSDDYYTSPGIRTGDDECWLLRLWPNWGKESKWMRLGVGRCDLGLSRSVHFSLGITGESGGVEKSMEGEREFSGYCDTYHWDSFCSRSELAEDAVARLLPNIVLNVSFVLKRPGAVKDNDLLKKEEVSLKEQIKTLQEKIENSKSQSENYKMQIRALESEKLSIADAYKCQLEEKVTVLFGLKKDKDLLEKQMEHFLEQIKTLQKRVKSSELESKNYKMQITALEREKLSSEEEYKQHLEENITTISGLEKDNEQLKKEVESLKKQNQDFCTKYEEQTHIISESSLELNKAYMDIESHKKEIEFLIEQNKDLNRKCEEQTHIISETSSELKTVCLDSESHKKEILSLVEQIKNLERAVENYQTPSEIYNKQMSSLDNELISREHCDGENKLTISSRLKKVPCHDDDTVDENSNDEVHEQAKIKKNTKQPIQEKKTKKIALPARHGDVICSLKSILVSGSRADLTLKSGSSEWHVHKAILESRSGHFKDLLQGAQEDELRLDDITKGAIDAVLHFLYTGEVDDMSVENVCSVHAAAHELNLKELNSLCVKCMKEWMCPELVCFALVVAERYKDGDLKEEVLDCYFRESKKVVLTEGWKELKRKHPAIIVELFNELIRREWNNQRKEKELL